jgi:arsenate reductase
MITLYGIPNCDTVKKARTWLETNNLEYVFHNFKKDGITPDLITPWLKEHTWELLINKKGTTWRALSQTEQNKVQDAKSAVTLMCLSPSIIKRPVLFLQENKKQRTYLGFSNELYQSIFKDAS